MSRIIKRVKVKRTTYFLLDRPKMNEDYEVVKQSVNGISTTIYRSTSVVDASCYFDNLCKK